MNYVTQITFMATNDSNLVFGVLDLADIQCHTISAAMIYCCCGMCNNSANKSYLNEILSGFEEPF